MGRSLPPPDLRVGAHIDRSLTFYGASMGCPIAVSVLYVQVPERLAGGELRLYHRGQQVATLAQLEETLYAHLTRLPEETAGVLGAVLRARLKERTR